MPYDDPDPTDPMTLTGVELEVDGPGAMREMAECFVEEYVRLGLSPESILDLFAKGDFSGPTLALHHLGRETIKELISEQFQLRGPIGVRTQIDQLPGGAIALPVLE